MYFLIGCNAMFKYLRPGTANHMILNANTPNEQPHPNALLINMWLKFSYFTMS